MKDLTDVFSMHGKWVCAAVSIVLICFAITACDVGPVDPVPLTYDEAVKKVTFTGDLATVDFTNLNSHDIYLVMINGSDFVVPATGTGGVAHALSVIPPGENIETPPSAANGREDGFYRHHIAELERSANLPPIDKYRSAGLSANAVLYDVGAKRNFWVERNFGGNAWENRQATLMASGDHGNVWIMDENNPSGTSRNIISVEQAQELARLFDMIYLLTTNLLGYEHGGGPHGDGGVDGDKKIQILAYDFYTPGYWFTGTSYVGYFSSKDFYSQTEIGKLGWDSKTNVAEIFYISASALISSPDYIHSVLIHEFQHMINFSRKYVEHDLNTDTWYNEMLSTMAEDVIAPLIGIGHTNPGHPISMRIPEFLESYYRYGITEWDNSRYNYANAYAFGAYLLRNYGGPELLKKILDNDNANVDSLTMALEEFCEGMDFSNAFNRYSEAMIFNGSSMPEGVVSFDKTVTSTVNGQEYTAYGFDIWRTSRSGTNDMGPLVLDLKPASMRPHSVIMRSTDQWKSKTGDFSITLEKPANQNVVLYLMAKSRAINQ